MLNRTLKNQFFYRRNNSLPTKELHIEKFKKKKNEFKVGG